MPKRKFGKSAESSLRDRTKLFLQIQGYSSFFADPLIDQLKPSDLKIKYDRSGKDKVQMEFRSMEISDNDGSLEYILCTVGKFSFILYVSEKNDWRCFVPTKGNSFCKKKKKTYGYCGCCSEIYEPFSGSFNEEIRKRMQFGGYNDNDIKVSKKSHLPPTEEWNDDKNVVSSYRNSPKRICPPRTFEKINLVHDLIWNILFFIPSHELFSTYERICKLWRGIVKNPVFQKRRWNNFYEKNKEYAFNIKANEQEIMEMATFVPCAFDLGIGGVFESMNYKLIRAPEITNHYLINKLHVILPTLISHIPRQMQLHKKETEEMRKRGEIGKYDSRRFFPYPIHETTPQPVILRTDLEHEYILDKQRVEKYLTDNGSYNSMYDCGYENISEIMKTLKSFAERDVFKEHSIAQKTITKLYRCKAEFEYYDGSVEENKIKYDKKTNKIKIKEMENDYEEIGGYGLRRPKERIDQQQSTIKEYIEEDLGSWSQRNDNIDKIGRVRKIINDLKNTFGNVMLFKGSQFDCEETGYLWILAEIENYCVGYTWFVMEN